MSLFLIRMDLAQVSQVKRRKIMLSKSLNMKAKFIDWKETLSIFSMAVLETSTCTPNKADLLDNVDMIFDHP